MLLLSGESIIMYVTSLTLKGTFSLFCDVCEKRFFAFWLYSLTTFYSFTVV
uniref:Uncharacterized protein n=1 Tax=Dreissena polymorpha TaxID=45954 RepID=A0A1P8NLW4_DREPO|nr:hypothetical protein [Dreissena polymorpha]